ncbi:minichromosome maintenance protein [Maudiozyma exigua]|uniref:Minichromosome maintenance protein n=1 Tax=Maudiozyma exigua TaxID=34358 RepID=A0A9P7BBH9_MAUEX|nr:minichromosome maintenance protein [Kazachstania exigua]
MSTLEELEQDINALREEINSLNAKTNSIKKAIKDKKNGNRVKKPHKNENPVISEFKTLFDHFPQLNDILHSDNQSALGTTKNHLINYDTVDRSVSRTPKQRNGNITGEDDLPETEWVLKNQIPLAHQMFDKSIVDEVDVDILSSPSKRRAELKKIEPVKPIDNKFDNKVLLENMFRLLGITFFPLIDPSDLKLNDKTEKIEITRQMLGIRFDLFNEHDSRFDKPFYILLKKSNSTKNKANGNTDNPTNNENGEWVVFKHTIPIYIDIQGIMNDLEIKDASSYDEIFIFAKEVYMMLLENMKRRKLLSKMEADGLIKNLKNDFHSTSISFTVKKIKFQLYLEKNVVVSCSITSGMTDAVLKTKWETVFSGPLEELEFKIKQLI